MTTRRILITGSSRGIGRACALRLARAGFDIVVHGRSASVAACNTVARIEALGQKASLLTFDVTDREAANNAIEKDVQRHGAYWGIVLNAGIHSDAPLVGMEDQAWDQVIATGLDGFYNVIKPALLPMCRKKEGRIVIMSSVSGLYGTRGQTNYSAAKAGLIGAAKALAYELASRNITVNTVAPGLINTEMVSKEEADRILPFVPMKRMGSVEEVASVVSFLMSPQASYITRAVIPVSGGL